MKLSISKTAAGSALYILIFIVFSSPSFAGIVGSRHDLRGNVAFGNPQEVCNICHIPHQSPTASYLAPSGRVYSGSTLTIYGGTVSQPTNSSSVCLSCHDGALAPAVGTTSTDYTHSHPFSMVYPVKTGYASAVSGAVTGTYGSLPLEGNPKTRLECGTCHNPHEPGTNSKFVRIQNTNSNLCFTCHQK